MCDRRRVCLLDECETNFLKIKSMIVQKKSKANKGYAWAEKAPKKAS